MNISVLNPSWYKYQQASMWHYFLKGRFQSERSISKHNSQTVFKRWTTHQPASHIPNLHIKCPSPFSSLLDLPLTFLPSFPESCWRIQDQGGELPCRPALWGATGSSRSYLITLKLTTAQHQNLQCGFCIAALYSSWLKERGFTA